MGEHMSYKSPCMKLLIITLLLEGILTSAEQSEAATTFETFDTDHDGHLSESESTKMMAYGLLSDENLNDDEIGRIVRDADADEDGVVNKSEFEQIMNAVQDLIMSKQQYKQQAVEKL